ncbi:MAG: low specificity L-threonine aldolase [Bacteroidales bacterium]|nr:low specificity L-threonine aldolase [Candidatus Colimorpha onthohippi]
MQRGFGSDNHSGICPEVIEAICQVNSNHALAYGDDEYCHQAEELFKQHFGAQARPYFAFNGTGANILCIDAMCRSQHAVICADTAHINVDECGAPQRLVGCRLLTIATPDGKLTPELIQQHLHGFGFQHHSQPRAISITQPTELGTLYTVNEIKALASLAHQYHMYLHVDGARLANAAVATGLSFREMTTDCGVDCLSFGGTKNGLMMGECCLLLNPELDIDMLYRRKQLAQLYSKMRYVAAQFIAYLKDDLWKRNATHSNQMAQRLLDAVRQIPTVRIMYPVQANSVFVQMPSQVWRELQQSCFFYEWDEAQNVVRWMCSFDTTEDDIAHFLATLQTIIDKYSKQTN